MSHAAALCAVRALYARPLACLGLSPFVCARRSVSVRCPLFLCVGRCERLCHSPRACTPSTLSLRETSPHQPPHTRRPPRVTCDRGSRTLSSPRRGRDSAYRPEPRGHFLLRWTSPRHTLARAWVRPHRARRTLFSIHQGRGVPGTNLVCHISPRLRFVFPQWVTALWRQTCS